MLRAKTAREKRPDGEVEAEKELMQNMLVLVDMELEKYWKGLAKTPI